MKDMIEFLIRGLVTRPDDVHIDLLEGTKTSVMEIHVAEEDLGHVIGKQGRTIKALRTVLRAANLKKAPERNVILEVIEI